MNWKPWIENVYRPALVAAMVGCWAASAADLVHVLAPAWNPVFLTISCVLAALEAQYSYSLIRARSVYGIDIVRFRLVELLLLFILLKAGGYIGQPWPAVLADILSWPGAPWNLFDSKTLTAFALAFITWQAATEAAFDLGRLGEAPEAHSDYVSPLDSLVRRFFWGGAILLATTGLTRIGLAEVLNLRHPPVPGLALNVLIYFFLGLAMLAQLNFDRMQTQWRLQGVEMAHSLPMLWLRYSLILIGLAAVLAFVLPTRYTLGLMETIGLTLELLFGLVSSIALAFMLLCGIPLGWFFRLVFGQGGEEAAPPMSEPPAFPQPLPAGAGPSWYEFARSVFFWLVAIGVLVYVISTYLRERPELMKATLAWGPFQALRRWWAALRRRLAGWGQTVRRRWPRRWPALFRAGRPAMEGSAWRFLRLGALSPRQRILYYYLSILQRAGRQGLTRRLSQTPHEYDLSLRPALPQAQEDMAALTEAFVEARYSQHTVEADWVKRVRAQWQAVRAALRAMRHGR